MSYNPYYAAEKLGLSLISFEGAGYYEFNTLCFWSNDKGEVYMAQDSGCSCPTPFEGYCGDNVDDVIRGLERVKDVEGGIDIFNSWNDAIYNNEYKNGNAERDELRNWLVSKFNNE